MMAGAWLALVLGTVAAGSAVAQSGSPALESYLGTVEIGARELAAAARGSAVVRLLSTTNDRDVAVIGLIGVRAPRDSVAARAVDVAGLLASRGGRFHVFGSHPTVRDVRDVEFDPSEYRDLRGCRPGDCDFKMPASGMREFVAAIDWSSAEAKMQADEKFRAALLELAVDYLARGNEAMLVYDDVRGVRASEVFQDLVEQAVELRTHAPELAGYLMTHPAGRPARARDVLYWSEERVSRLRPMFTLNHVVVHLPPNQSPAEVLVARKQIYANHYFEGALELLAIVDGGEPPEPEAYVVVVRRFRFDNLPGGPQNIRGMVRSRLVEATRSDLERQWGAMGRPETR